MYIVDHLHLSEMANSFYQYCKIRSPHFEYGIYFIENIYTIYKYRQLLDAFMSVITN